MEQESQITVENHQWRNTNQVSGITVSTPFRWSHYKRSGVRQLLCYKLTLPSPQLQALTGEYAVISYYSESVTLPMLCDPREVVSMSAIQTAHSGFQAPSVRILYCGSCTGEQFPWWISWLVHVICSNLWPLPPQSLTVHSDPPQSHLKIPIRSMWSSFLRTSKLASLQSHTTHTGWKYTKSAVWPHHCQGRMPPVLRHFRHTDHSTQGDSGTLIIADLTV